MLFYVQQPENYEVAENYAKLKESVLASSDKPQAFDPKQMSSQIVAELSKVIAPGNETIGAMGSQQTNFHDAHFKRIASDEFRGLPQNSRPSGSEFRRGRNLGGQKSFRPRATNRVCYNLTQEFHDKTIPVEAVILMGSEIDLVATILVIIRETRCRPCCVGK